MICLKQLVMFQSQVVKIFLAGLGQVFVFSELDLEVSSLLVKLVPALFHFLLEDDLFSI